MRKNRAIDRTTDTFFATYQQQRIEHWDRVAVRPARFDQSGYYHRRLGVIFSFLVSEGQRVIEIGSGNGDLLASLRPSRGVGVDFSPAMVKGASLRHPSLEFVIADAHALDLNETFDIVILSDLVNDLWDVQAVLERVLQLCTPTTRIILNFHNKAWQGPLGLARRLGLANPVGLQNWLSVQDIRNLLHLSGFDVVTESSEILLPMRLGPLSWLFNRVIVKFWPAQNAGLAKFVVARPQVSALQPPGRELSVSVIVAARNEAGNIESIVERTPRMGSSTQLIFVEGNSTDDTYDEIERVLAEKQDENLMLLRQPGEGKGDAVRFGFEHATGDILMILDADMTVAPEELPRFYAAIADGTAEFVNGVRLVYPMQTEAMRFLNYLGNKFFGLVFSWILRQPVKDTLCGTKVLTREAYDVITDNRSYFGDFDPFGDFDLLFGAAKSNLKIVDMPIRYRDRTYGDTNISRWRHGVLLLRMAAFASRRLRFI
ncbi:Glycosyltransferase [hydrothermal vent metagenome]|uniref:Glycosyltransferase n=1 Tax=hydrothermal vent metagenome TaxID=652676 RepID=A0A3B0RLV1_9ZZZZ